MTHVAIVSLSGNAASCANYTPGSLNRTGRVLVAPARLEQGAAEAARPIWGWLGAFAMAEPARGVGGHRAATIGALSEAPRSRFIYSYSSPNAPASFPDKRHILADRLDLLLSVVVHPADVQDRDEAFHLSSKSRSNASLQPSVRAPGGVHAQQL